jgi:competence ComEA-like helix-hairpin-helix protein
MPQERSGKVNLNNASFEEIAQLPGVNYDKAQSIVDHRPFRSWDDLKKVEGFTDSNIDTLKDNCTI